MRFIKFNGKIKELSGSTISIFQENLGWSSNGITAYSYGIQIENSSIDKELYFKEQERDARFAELENLLIPKEQTEYKLNCHARGVGHAFGLDNNICTKCGFNSDKEKF